MATKWGIMIGGKLSRDFTTAAISQISDEHKVHAIATILPEESGSLKDVYGVDKVYGSYEELIKDEHIDMIYIGSELKERHKLCLLCLNAGKNVLCEKPVTMTLASAKEVFALAKEKKLFFMEGYWSRFFPVYEKVRKELTSGSLGDVVSMVVTLCHDISIDTGEQTSGGALSSVGTCALMVVEMVFREKPTSVQAVGQDDGGGALLSFRGGRHATICYGVSTECLDNSVLINGTKGSIKVESPFWCPTRLTTTQGEFEFPLPECSESIQCLNGEGLMYQQNYARQCLLKGQTECAEMSVDSSETIQYMVDAIHRQTSHNT